MKRGLLVLLWLPMAASGDESQVRLKEGPGKDLVASRCAICHSLDYLPMNSPFLDPAGWEKEVDKMVKVMGAPITEDERLTILRYLNGNYGK
jgi:mono/diheme cytochrome c family protein